jgi:ParB-like chromosome segregation protein Spo0J
VTIESVPVETLCADPANARVHSARNIDAIKASFTRFGQQKPIVVDFKGVVRAGNGTLAAAKALGWENINVVKTDLIGSDAAAYAIADNRTSDLSDWDDDALARQLESLRAEGTDMADVGFNDDDLAELLAKEDETVAPTVLIVRNPPSMTWMLVGIPTVRFGEISTLIEQIAAVPGTVVETTTKNAPNKG